MRGLANETDMDEGSLMGGGALRFCMEELYTGSPDCRVISG